MVSAAMQGSLQGKECVEGRDRVEQQAQLLSSTTSVVLGDFKTTYRCDQCS